MTKIRRAARGSHHSFGIKMTFTRRKLSVPSSGQLCKLDLSITYYGVTNIVYKSHTTYCDLTALINISDSSESDQNGVCFTKVALPHHKTRLGRTQVIVL